MTNALNVIPTRDEVETGLKNTDAMAQGVEHMLADTYRLPFKTHGVLWNFEGLLFFAVHDLTEGQYNDLFAVADEIAERIRALGHLVPAILSSIVSHSVVEDDEAIGSAGEMCESLAADQEQVAARHHKRIKVAAENEDPVTEERTLGRAAFHEKAAWMLRAISKS